MGGATTTATPLRSRIVASTRLDLDALRPELRLLTDRELSQEYSDFTFGGSWSNCVLRNGTGEAGDTELREFEGPAQATPLAGELPAIAALAAETFDLSHVRWMRVFKLRRGFMLPHRDYLEMEEGFTRLHLTLQTDETCLHSEGEHVYHMRTGEIWLLDTSEVHSVAALGDTTRLSLCLDLAPGIPLERLVRRPLGAERREPFLVDRPPIDSAVEAEIDRLLAGADEASFRDVVATLSAYHFRYAAHAAAVFDWLVAGLGKAGKERLAERAVALRRYAIEDRGLGERFFDA
jgi:L-proline cis-4-hydroxylase